MKYHCVVLKYRFDSISILPLQTLLGFISVSKLSTSDIESSLTSVGFFWSRDFPNMNKDEMGQLKHDEIFAIVAKTSKGAFNNYVDRILPFFDPPPTVYSNGFYADI